MTSPSLSRGKITIRLIVNMAFQFQIRFEGTYGKVQCRL